MNREPPETNAPKFDERCHDSTPKTGVDPTDGHRSTHSEASIGRDKIRRFLAQHPPFDQIETDVLDDLINDLECRAYPAGACLTTPDSGPAQRFHIIQRGRVHGETPSEDERITGDAWALIEGECFPIGALIGRRPVRTTHRAVVDTRCLELDRDAFDRLRTRSPIFADFCSRRIASLLDRLQGPSAIPRVRVATTATSSEDRATPNHTTPDTLQPAASGGTGDDDVRATQPDPTRALSPETRVVDQDRCWSDPVGSNALETPLGVLVNREPITCSPATSIRDALTRMRQADVGSIVVTENRRPLGLFTLKDLLRETAADQLDLSAPIRRVMTQPAITCHHGARGIDALETFAEYGIKHAVIIDDDGHILGVLSERELLRRTPQTVDRLVSELRQASSLDDLHRALAGRIGLAAMLYERGVSADEILRVISHIHEHATRRTLVLIGQNHDLAGLDWQWLSFGSAARFEQALITDQDNGIIFDDADCDRTERDSRRQRLLSFASAVNDALATLGFEHCPGGIMAGRPDCCLSIEEWRQNFVRWVDQGTPEHLLKASIFFDWRVTVDAGHADARSRFEEAPEAFRQPAQRNTRFRRQLAAVALENRPPLTWLGRLQGDSHGVDIKRGGLTPMVDAARILALEVGGRATSTLQRLHDSAAAEALKTDEARDYIAATRFFQRLRLEAQLRSINHGETTRATANLLKTSVLDHLEQRLLKESFRLVRRLQQTLSIRYQL
ncbi:MAG: DUF294 nucleotidyltransferase-like domain-containing protein [Thioalkalivibrionaceae bacterium]